MLHLAGSQNSLELALEQGLVFPATSGLLIRSEGKQKDMETAVYPLTTSNAR